MFFGNGLKTYRRLLHGAAMVAACAALSCGAGFAADDVSLAFHEKDGRYDINGFFYVPADAGTAWNVLSDYDHIPGFVHDMKLSRVQVREGNDVLLRQEAEGGFLFFTQKVRLFLHVQETPGQSILFTDIAHKDFKSYTGAWTIESLPATHELKITYQLQAESNFSAPAFLASDAVKGGAKALLVAVRKEILSRQAALPRAAPSSVTVTQVTSDKPEAAVR
ncbi:MAG TPA: SRPBCC family protein [bacterium]|nr:SRPBCC family protein [bacterium]